MIPPPICYIISTVGGCRTAICVVMHVVHTYVLYDCIGPIVGSELDSGLKLVQEEW